MRTFGLFAAREDALLARTLDKPRPEVDRWVGHETEDVRMSSALDRAIASLDRLIVLAPPYATIPSFFRYVPVEPSEHNHFLEAVQRLRGNVYFEDGAITADELTSDGRHETPEDSRAWHLLMRARTGVTACVSYFEHEDASSVEELRVRKCPLNHTTDWRNTFRRAVEAELGRAKRERLRYVELGGWAVAPTERHRGDGLLLALAAYSLGRAFGGSLGLTTATVRHASPQRRRSEEHTSELQSLAYLVCRLLLEKKKDRLALTA